MIVPSSQETCPRYTSVPSRAPDYPRTHPPVMDEDAITASFLDAKGNVSEQARNGLVKWLKIMSKAPFFANDILQNLAVVEVNILNKVDEPGKKEVQMVYELDVTEGASRSSLHCGGSLLKDLRLPPRSMQSDRELARGMYCGAGRPVRQTSSFTSD